MRPTLAVAGLTKSYDDIDAVTDLDLTLEPGTFTALIGPSGCGKSTTLQLIAGLVKPERGQISIDGVDVAPVPAERRPVSMVFQKPLLFPHLTVTQNVGFGLRMQRVSRSATSRRVADMLEQVQLAGFGDRRPHELSGGQEQRVALARALVLQPSLILLDEPFSQLDVPLRAEMRALVRNLHDSSGVTTLFVTHDQGEAVEIADQIVVMLDGKLEASGSPEELYAAPPTLASARFLGVGNELRGVASHGTFTLAGMAIDVGNPSFAGPAVLVVRPESLALTASTDRGALGVSIDSVQFAGTHLVVSAITDDQQVVTVHVAVGTAVRVGERAGVTVPAERCTVFMETLP